MGRKKKSARKKTTRRRRTRLSGAKKFAIVKAHQAGIPAPRLAKEFKVAVPSIYLWDKAVKKAKGKNPFGGEENNLTPRQQKLLVIAKRTK